MKMRYCKRCRKNMMKKRGKVWHCRWCSYEEKVKPSIQDISQVREVKSDLEFLEAINEAMPGQFIIFEEK